MGIALTLLTALIPVILKAFWARKDVTDAAKLRMLESMAPAMEAAGRWKSEAWADPVRAAALGVMPNAQGLRLDISDYTASRNPNEHPVP